MRVLIYRQAKGKAPEIWQEGLTLKAAKEKLKQTYLNGIELFFEEVTDNDILSADAKQLTLFNVNYWIEKDTRL